MPSDTSPPSHERDTDGREPTSRSLDALFRAFSKRHRRAAVLVLRDEDEPMPVVDLVERVVRRERIDVGEVEGVRTSFVHVHLPTLEAADLVSWDRERGSVSLNAPERCAAWFDLFEPDHRRDGDDSPLND